MLSFKLSDEFVTQYENIPAPFGFSDAAGNSLGENGKSCVICKEFKTLDNFYKRKGAKDGLRGECKSCKLSRQAKWKKENPERAAEIARRGSAAYRARNPEKISANNKKFRLENPDYISAWQENNRERVREYSRKNYYERGGKDLSLRRNARRRARLNGSSTSQYSVDEVVSVYGTTCYLCDDEIDLFAPRWTAQDGWQRGMHIDHFVPLILGGTDTIENVRPTHGLCNIKKKGSLISE